jgi:methyltransferase
MFYALCTAVAVARLFELRRSRAHERAMARRGGRVAQERAFAAMVALHAGTLIAAPVEARLRGRPPARLRAAAFGLLLLATALRGWTLRTLGDAWSVRVVRFDGARPVVTRGPYRFLRHPNYLAVIIELAALPLVGGAWVTALAATLTNAWVLSRRIPFEERALFTDERYRKHFARLPRVIPWPWPSCSTSRSPAGARPGWQRRSHPRGAGWR